MTTRIFHNFLSLLSSRKVWMMILVMLSLSMNGVASDFNLSFVNDTTKWDLLTSSNETKNITDGIIWINDSNAGSALTYLVFFANTSNQNYSQYDFIHFKIKTLSPIVWRPTYSLWLNDAATKYFSLTGNISEADGEYKEYYLYKNGSGVGTNFTAVQKIVFDWNIGQSDINISIKEFYMGNNSTLPCIQSIIGTPPNLLGDTIIANNTTWDCVNSTFLADTNITVGNISNRIFFNITNSSLDFNGIFNMAGTNLTNVTINNSTIFWNLTTTDSLKRIIMNQPSITSQISRLEINNSILKGVNNSILFGGVTIRSYVSYAAKFTVIIQNTNISYSTSAINFYGTGAPSDHSYNWQVSNDSLLYNISLYENTYGVKMSHGVGISNSTSTGTWGNQLAQFWGGEYIKNCTMNNASEGLYDPLPYSFVQDNIFWANDTKLNVMDGANVTFQRNIVYDANFNSGAGSFAFQGIYNIFRNNTFINSGSNMNKNWSRWYDNSFTYPNTNAIIMTWGSHNYYENTIIEGGNPAIELKPQTAYWMRIENNTYINTSINGTTYAITINNSNNTKFIDLFISNSTNHLRFGTYNTQSINNTINTTFTNSNINSSRITYSSLSNNSVGIYYYSDINITNSTGSPIPNVSITFTNTVNSSYPSINRAGTPTASFTTDVSGHTPLPIGNDSTTIVLANMSKNGTNQENMSYAVSVSCNNCSGDGKIYTTNSSVTISPDSSWYRPNPNTYQNTTTIILTESVNFAPPTPTNLTNTQGNFWINYTWSAEIGNLTDSYNVSVNGTWINGSSQDWSNGSVEPHGWSNITVYAYNNSGTGSLSETAATNNTQLSNNIPTLSVGNQTINEGQTVFISLNASDADGDLLTYSLNRTDLFSDFNATTGRGNWTTNYSSAGIYYFDAGVQDNYSAIANYTFNITILSTFTTFNSSILCISWCFLASNTTQTLLQIDNNYTYDTVQGLYNSTTQKYETHTHGYPSSQNSTVINKQGYSIYMKTSTYINTSFTNNPTITLKQGWNLIGNINNNSRNLSTLKTSIGASAIQAKHFNRSLQSWSILNTENVPPGESFFVYINPQTNWSD